ncbi:hypothetical protein BDZ97DRAFT_1226399 [Flammula alnicola]|nr:hypothetical protein BDZ97DRAFT_1226399 [Flammula alnicola]
MAYNHQQHYGQQEGNMQVYPDYGEYADIDDPAVAESRSSLFSASQPLFTREEINNTRTLDPYQTTQSPQSWPTYEPPFQQRSHSYAPYPSPSPFPPPRLSPPPPVHHQAFHFKAQGQSTSPNSASHRLTLAGSLDPATGIFYRTPEHPRLRTAQACEKCRTRKAKCSGEHPSCKRCITRGLICEYAKEGRVRGPNKPKPKNGATSSPSGSASIASTVTSRSKNNDTTPTNTNTGKSRPASSRHRNSSSHSSAGSSDQATKQSAAQSLQLPPSVGERNDQILHGEHSHHPSISGSSSPTSSTSTSASRGGHRSVVGHSASGSSSSRRNSLGEHRPSRPRPPDLHLSSASNLFRLSGGVTGEGTEPRSGSTAGVGMGMGDMGPGMGIGSPGIGQGTAGGDSVFYPLRHHTQPPQQHQHRTGPSQGYTPDPLMGRIGQVCLFFVVSFPNRKLRMSHIIAPVTSISATTSAPAPADTDPA